MLIAALGIVVFKVAVVAVTAASFRYGGRDEKEAALIVVATAIGEELVSVMGDDYRTLAWRTILLNIATLAAFLRIAFRSDSFWPLWISAFQLVALSCHVPKLIEPGLTKPVYSLLQQIWGFPILAVLVIGLLESSRRRTSGEAR